MLSLVTTSDGSHTIKNETTGDTYHSIHGAVQESRHVFIKHGLEHFISSFPDQKIIRILEVGLGTGLNALLSLQFVNNLKQRIEYVALEPFPLERKFYSELNYDQQNETLQEFHECDWERPVEFTPYFTFTKHRSEIQSIELPLETFNVVYFDAFAPNSQPEMWTFDVFSKLKNAMAPSAVLTTYCAKGEVKRTLRAAGFTVENLPGPPGKREMIRAKVA
jgi:tRNA U34 5-methylaminomethyl-2-thiouridine-forming methyltransferase MnmC